MQNIVRRLSMSKDDAMAQQSPRPGGVQNENELALKDMCDMQRAQLEAARTELDQLRAENEALKDELVNVNPPTPTPTPSLFLFFFPSLLSALGDLYFLFLPSSQHASSTFSPLFAFALPTRRSGEERAGCGAHAAARQAPARHRAEGASCNNCC
jgi:hypothetical protein